MRYFIYVIKAGITALSENTESQIKMTIKSQNTINYGDCIIGYCENPISEYRYIFSGLSMSNGKITLSKTLQILNGIKSNTVLFELDKKIQEEIVGGNDLIEITNEQYQTIENAILEQIGRTLNKKVSKNQSNISHVVYHHPPLQTIYYGVPGSGKSHKIASVLRELGIEKQDENKYTKRVVFHPEYTNADFVGQILPQASDDGKNISYPFTPGPFTQILEEAYTHQEKHYALIIEEINRGNAAAIFGELFQLLDRLDEDETEASNDVIYTKNWSTYPVNNDNINKAIQDAYIKFSSDNDFNPFIEKSVFDKYKLNVGIRLPPNLSILATMNTSDQNVFTLDNAFQRRWDMELVPNTCTDENQMNAKITVQNQTITWENFQAKINEVIAEKGNESGFSSMEDKRLGCWFIKNQDGVIDSDKFANKVLKYLWDDAFKFNRNDIFIDEIKNFEELKKSFIGEKGFGIFKDMNFSFETEQIEETQESQNE